MKQILFFLALLSLAPVHAKDIRVATFNVSFFRKTSGQLIADLALPNQPQIEAVTSLINDINPDVILLNEFDFDEKNLAVQAFGKKYLHDAYPYHFTAPVNTGVPSGMDMNHDGDIADPEDCFGFGTHPGQYGMVLLSKFPIDSSSVRTFQKFLWHDLPNNFLPTFHYSEDQQKILRLSSKSHWDVPVLIDGQTLHILCSHPTPPAFDDGQAINLTEKSPVDWNGRRNHDEIRLWAEYIQQPEATWLVDDKGKVGGLPAKSRFVILGDLNADPIDGNSVKDAAKQLLDHPLINASVVPKSEGALAKVPASFSQRETKTSHFNLRCDYVLPSRFGIEAISAGVHWPKNNPLIDLASDHRMVWVTIKITP